MKTLIAFYVLLAVALGYGWIENVVKIVHGGETLALFVVRCIGIFVAPLGAVLGYF